MKYLFSLVGDESRWDDVSADDMKQAMERWTAFDREALDAGVYVAGEGLQPSTTATTLRVQEQGEPIVSDGPFAETKEQLGGFYVLDCRNLDDALAWARKIPFRGGAIEVRPVLEYEAMGYEHPLQAQGARS
jgi:hypothetical protein